MTKTAQAVVLAVAELSGGLEECDLSKIYCKEEPFDSPSVDKDSTVELFVSTTEHTFTMEEEDDVEPVDEANGVDVVGYCIQLFNWSCY